MVAEIGAGVQKARRPPSDGDRSQSGKIRQTDGRLWDSCPTGRVIYIQSYSSRGLSVLFSNSFGQAGHVAKQLLETMSAF